MVKNRKLFLKEPDGHIYIRNSSGADVTFPSVESFAFYAGDLADSIAGDFQRVVYEPATGDRFVIYDDPGNPSAPVPPESWFRAVINSVAALASRASNPLYGLTEANAYATAIERKLAELDAYRDMVKNKEDYLFTWDSGAIHHVYVDEQSIEKMITVCRAMPASAPVITADGTWKTADVVGVDNVYVPTTVGELIRLRDEMIVRGLHNWGYCDAHKKIIKQALNNKTMTPRQILDYDTYKTNWSLT